MDFVQQLKIFVSVAEHGSFARAAEALRMGRPGVTTAVSSLEDTVGARLLHRTTRHTSLTSQGEIFYKRAVQLIADVSETQNLFGGPGETPKGRLRVDIPVALAKPVIIPNLPDFTTTYPQIELTLGVSDQPVDLLAEGIDCVLRIGDLPIGSMISRLVANVTMVTCASPAYLAKHGVPMSTEDLTLHRAATYFSGRGRRTIDLQLGHRDDAVKMRPSILVNDTEALVACGLAGLGLIQVSGTMVDQYLASGELVEVLSQRAAKKPLSLMYPNRQHLSPQVQVFIAWAVSLFRNLESRWIEKP
jgi:LysR family transcriptional regulator for bpeEF and oprC